MAKMSDFKLDTNAIQDGIWLRVNESVYGDLEIRTRGYTDQFVDAQTHRLIRAAEPYGGDQARIPNAVRREVNTSLLRDFLLLDVRNLMGGPDEDVPVTIEEFRATLEDPAFFKLSKACFDAAARVSTASATQLKAAVGNSPPDSDGT